MMKGFFPTNRYQPKSLSAQIRDAERQVLIRQRRVGVNTATLTRKLAQQMATPVNLLLAGSVGYMLGELSRQQAKRGGRSGQAQVKNTPLRSLLALITSFRTLYLVAKKVLPSAPATGSIPRKAHAALSKGHKYTAMP
ncbi:MAG: hypothetical protein Q7U57_08350 [Methylovulum sp.]|nr:hypothetical protein [Methylovulum sp.]